MNIKFIYEIMQKSTFHFLFVRLRNCFPSSATKQDTITPEKHADINGVNNYLAFEECKQLIKLYVKFKKPKISDYKINKK